MFNFGGYLKEAKNTENFVEMCYSHRFHLLISKLQMKKNKIADELVRSEGSKFDVSFVDVTDKDDYISYITSNKAKQTLDKYRSINRLEDGINLCWTTNRQEQNLRRFINRIFGSKFTQKEIEDFVEDYKVVLKGDKTFENFEIIDGEDIRKYYNAYKYSDESNGQLQRSCMKYDHCQPYFDIYVENPTKMKMLILKQKNKIYGRANLWYLDRPSEKIFMDRIYTTHDWQIKLFIDYAIRNDYIFKSKQIYGGSVIPLIKDGRKEKMIISVNLEPKKYKYYPYVDTLQFYNPTTGLLTSDVEKFHDKDFVTLVMANGEYYRENRGGYGIDNLGRIVNSQLLIWSEIDQVHIHRDNAVPLFYRGRNVFVTQDHEFVNIDGIPVLKEDAIYDEDKKTWTIKKNI